MDREQIGSAMAACDRLVAVSVERAMRMCRRYRPERAELTQRAWLALLLAFHRHDPSRAQWNTYADRTLRWLGYEWLKSERHWRAMVSIEDLSRNAMDADGVLDVADHRSMDVFRAITLVPSSGPRKQEYWRKFRREWMRERRACDKAASVEYLKKAA